MNKILRYSLVALMALMGGGQLFAAYEKTTAIAAGDVILLTAETSTVKKELSTITTTSTPIGQVVDYESTPAGVYPLTVEAGSAEGSFAFKNSDGKYLSWASGNSLTTAEEKVAASSWTVSFDESGAVTITNVGTTARILQYNAGSPRFACYGNSNQTKPILWKQVADGSVAAPTISGTQNFVGSAEVTITAEEGADIHYTTDGTDPTTASTKYTAAITLTETTTIKAIAAKDGKTSTVASKTFTKQTVISVKDAQAAENGTTVTIEGTVVASAANGAVISDGTDYIYYYNTSNALEVGQKVRMVGAISEYGGAKQMPANSTITQLGTETVTHPTPTVLTTDDFTAILAAKKVAERKYVEFEGNLTISNNYYNIALDGTTDVLGSIVKPKEDLSSLNGKKVKVTGYLMYINGKYVYAVATKVEEVTANAISTVKAAAVQNGAAYNLAGQQVTSGYKGLVIVNGKKVIRK